MVLRWSKRSIVLNKVDITTGFTFPTDEIVKKHYDNAKRLINMKPRRLRHRSLRAASATATFLSIVSILAGFTKIPHLDFLSENGEVGMRAVQSFRLEEPVWESVKPIVDTKPETKLRLSGILENEILSVGATVTPKGTRLVMKYDPGRNQSRHDEKINRSDFESQIHLVLCDARMWIVH